MPKAQKKNLVNVAEAKAHLSELLRRVERGEEIWIGRYGRLVAKLVPPEAPIKLRRTPGAWKGKVWMAEDFDAADEELAQLLEGEPLEPPLG